MMLAAIIPTFSTCCVTLFALCPGLTFSNTLTSCAIWLVVLFCAASERKSWAALPDTMLNLLLGSPSLLWAPSCRSLYANRHHFSLFFVSVCVGQVVKVISDLW